jgi:hypothetical protein
MSLLADVSLPRDAPWFVLNQEGLCKAAIGAKNLAVDPSTVGASKE